MKLTASSSPTRAKKMAIGSNATKNIITLEVKIGHSIPLRILSRVCPATRFANNISGLLLSTLGINNSTGIDHILSSILQCTISRSIR